MSTVHRVSGQSSVAGVKQRQAQQQALLAQRQRQLQLQQQAEEDAARKRRRNTIIVIIVVSIVVLIIAGVLIWYFLFGPGKKGGSGTGTGSGASGVALGGACQTSTNCQTGLICSANLCKNPPQSNCTGANTCPNDYSCVNGKCVGIVGGTCSKNTDCQSPLICNSQSCAVKPCTTQTDCDAANGGQCNGSVCISLKDGYCKQTLDCAPPYGCDGTKCIVESCTTIANCSNVATVGFCDATNKTCTLDVNKQCVENSQCDSNPNNTPGGSIVSECSVHGKCGFLVGSPCTNNTDCMSGDCHASFCACTTNVDCTPTPGTSKCDVANGSCVECLADADCPTAKPHCDPTSHACVASCTSDADCPPNISCLTSGICGFCSTNADCPLTQPVCCLGFNNPPLSGCIAPGICHI